MSGRTQNSTISIDGDAYLTFFTLIGADYVVCISFYERKFVKV